MRRAIFLTIGTIAAGLAAGAAPALALPSGNLLTNPSAEAGPGSTDPDCGGDVGAKGWSRTGKLTVVRFGTGEFPAIGSGDGAQFFAGGCAASSTGEQQVDLSRWAPEVNTGQAGVRLSGLVGGYLDHADSAKVEAFFVGPNGADLGQPGADLVLAPVTPADRNKKTGFVAREATGKLPVGTRTVRVRMTMTRKTGNANDGYVDALRLTVSAPGTGAPPDDEAADDPRRPTAATVRCDRGPLPSSDSHCQVTVADAGPPPRVAPTGRVTWKVTGQGSIAGSGACTLQVSGASPGVSFCSVTYHPGRNGTPGGTEIPVTADYEGSDIHRPTSQHHRLIDAKVVDPATGEQSPSVDECNALADEPKPTATMSVDRKYANPEVNSAGQPTGYQEGIFEAGARRTAYCVEFVGTGFWEGGKATLVGAAGLTWTGAWGAGMGAIATVGEPGVGTVIGAGVGAATGWELGGGAMVKASGEMFDATSKALTDPPDRRYKQLVKVRATKPVRIRAKGRSARTDARVLGPWMTELARAGAIAVALGQTIDKVGGAQQAGDASWQGRQMRHAIALADQLARSSDELDRLGRSVAQRARVSPAAKRRPSLRGFAKLRRQVAAKGFTKAQRRKLRKAGFPALEIERMRLAARDRSLRDRDLVQAPSRNIARLAAGETWRGCARFFRLWVNHPQVKQIAAQQ